MMHFALFTFQFLQAKLLVIVWVFYISTSQLPLAISSVLILFMIFAIFHIRFVIMDV